MRCREPDEPTDSQGSRVGAAVAPAAEPLRRPADQGLAQRQSALEDAIRRVARRIAVFQPVATAVQVVLVVGLIGTIFVMDVTYHDASFRPWVEGTALACAWLLCTAASALAKRLALRILDDVGRVEDPALVGPLIDALALEDMALRSAIRVTLVRLLLRLRPEHASFMSPSRLSALHELLEAKDARPELKVAILRALVHVGDEASLGYVQSVAYRNRLPEDPVRDAGRECLPLLEERLSIQHAAPSLLRPAVAPDENTLLRPAGAVPDGDPSALLRPAERAQDP